MRLPAITLRENALLYVRKLITGFARITANLPPS